MSSAMRLAAAVAFSATACLLSAAPSVFPTGVTINEPQATWKGYTVLSLLGAPYAAVLDMNGKVVKTWEGFNSSAGGPVRVFPGGQIVAPAGANPGHQESIALVAQDFSGQELWRFDRNLTIALNGQPVNSLRQHHDWQRADFPAGYYSPAYTPSATARTNTLVLTHINRVVPAVGPGEIEDDRLIELDADGRIVWEWRAGDHVEEFGFDTAAREAISRATTSAPRGAGPAGAGGAAGAGGRSGGPAGPPTASRGGGAGGASRGFDWLHVNSATWLGPNKWFDAGDKRFAPENVLISSLSGAFLAIIARDGKIVWRMGPDFSKSPDLVAIGQIVGQHHAHLIPKGLPGEGNLMVFDNGGNGGYGPPSGIAPQGVNIYGRYNSRVLEIDPVAMKRVWMYSGANFFSFNVSGAQRLPNGNTLITEGAVGRIFEVTTEGKIVWEFMNDKGASGRPNIYRAYRVPYSWLPQLPQAAN